MAADSLTPKQERFCEEYLIDLNATQAAIRAGYSERTARGIASNLLTKVNIQERIGGLRNAASKRAGIALDDLLRELAAIAFLDPLEVFEDNGTVKPLSEMSEEARRAIAGIKRKEISGPQMEETTIEVKLLDKLGALEKLMRHLGGYEQDNRQHQDRLIIVGDPKEFDV
jgi:phage terminase small subunit